MEQRLQAMGERLRGVLGHRGTRWGAALLGMALTLPSLTTGLSLDDRIQRAMMRGESEALSSSVFDLFRTATGDPRQVGAAIEVGAFPWFTVPDLQVGFFRPLASLTHALDYAVWPEAAVWMHTQNLLWYGALVLAVGALFRRLTGATWLAGVATLLYAVDDAHGRAVSWIACRNALMAGVFAALTIVAHDRWRRDGWLAGRWWAALGLALGLLSSELALGAVAFLSAYALVIERRPWRDRLFSLGPYLPVLLVWALTYRLFGFGTRGGGYYVDPLHEPRAFLVGLVHNGPRLLSEQLGAPSAPLASLPSAWPVLLFCWGLLLLVFVPLLRKDRLARAWALAMVLALVPLTGTLTEPRLLVVAGIGGIGLAMRLLDVLVRESRAAPRSRAWRVGGWVLIALLAARASGAPFRLARQAAAQGHENRAALDALAAAPTDLHGRTLIVLQAPDAFAGASWFVSPSVVQRAPSRVRTLYVGPGPVLVSRLDASTLSVRADHGLLGEPASWVFRGLQHPLREGDVVQLSDMRISVAGVTADGRPSRLVVRLAAPMEDARWAWVTWTGGAFRTLDSHLFPNVAALSP